MSLYLDTSVLVALFTDDAQSTSADLILRSVPDDVVFVSDFAAAEFASAISRKVRMGELSSDEARETFADLDAWVAQGTSSVEVGPVDVELAGRYLRRLDLTLRTPDAIHIAMAERLRARLATLDLKMAASARTLGIAVS